MGNVGETNWLALLRVERADVWVFAAAFGLRTAYAFFVLMTAGEHGFVAFSDAQAFYYQAALNLLNHHTFSIAPSAPFVPDAYHTILYPLFVAGLLALHLPLFGVVIVQDVLAAVAVVLIYRSAISLTNSRHVAIVAATLTTIEPMSIYWSGLLMSDTLFMFLMIAAFYLLLKERPYWSGAALGLATLTRPIGLYLAPVFIGMIVYQEMGKRRSLIEVGRVVAVTLAIFAIVVAPWYVRNKLTFNTWALSSAGWYLAYQFPVYEFTQVENLPHPHPPDEDSVVHFDFAHAVLYKQLAVSTISHDPAGFAIVYGKRAIYSLVSDRYYYLVHYVIEVKMQGLYERTPPAVIKSILIVGQIFWATIYFLCVVAVRERRVQAWWLFFMVLVTLNLLLSGGINPVGTDMSRYMLPLDLFFFTFAVIGAKQMLGKPELDGANPSST